MAGDSRRSVLPALNFDPTRIFDAYREKGEKGFYLLALSQSEPCRRTPKLDHSADARWTEKAVRDAICIVRVPACYRRRCPR